jgi:hypothetical protein
VYVHGPPTRPLSDATAPRGSKGDTLKFNVKKNIWNEETSINLIETVLKVLPLENEDSMLLPVQEDSDAKTPLVMLKTGQGKTMQVYALTKAVKNQASCGQYKGLRLYRWAIVMKRKETNQLKMITVADKVVTYESEYYGSLLGSQGITLLTRSRECIHGSLWRTGSL